MLISRHFRLKFGALPCPVFLLKQIVLFALLVTILFMLLGRDITLYMEKNKRIETISSEVVLDEGKYIFDRWQAIGDPTHRYRIFSAYFDDRLEVVENYQDPYNRSAIGSVRAICILPITINNDGVICNFRFKNESDIIVQPMKVIHIQEYFHTTFIASFVICPVVLNSNEDKNDLPEAVGILYSKELSMTNVSSLVQIRYPAQSPQTLKDELAVCVGPAQGDFKNALRVVEFVEFYKLLGVTKFYIYNNSITENVDKVFRYYKSKGIFDVLEWNVEGYLFEKELRYNGIFAAINDCMYRATIVDNLKYIAVIDFDEILMPRLNQTVTLLELLKMKDNSTIHSFVFLNVFFFYKYEKYTNNIPKNSPNKFLYTQTLGRRTHNLNIADRSKFIAKGKEILELGNHVVYKTLRNKTHYIMDKSEGLLHHYRDKCLDDHCDHATIVDHYARRFENPLWSNVDTVCSQIFENGSCVFNNLDEDLHRSIL